MEAYPPAYNEPCQERLLRQAAAEDVLDQHEQAALWNGPDGKCVMLVYFATDTDEKIQVGDLSGDAVYGAWFDPKDGSLTEVEDLQSRIRDGVLPVKNASADGEDRILILAKERDDIAVASRNYGQEKTEEEMRKVFEW